MTFEELREQYPIHWRRAMARLDDKRLAQLLDQSDQMAVGHYVWHVFETVKFEVEQHTEKKAG